MNTACACGWSFEYDDVLSTVTAAALDVKSGDEPAVGPAALGYPGRWTSFRSDSGEARCASG